MRDAQRSCDGAQRLVICAPGEDLAFAFGQGHQVRSHLTGGDARDHVFESCLAEGIDDEVERVWVLAGLAALKHGRDALFGPGQGVGELAERGFAPLVLPEAFLRRLEFVQIPECVAGEPDGATVFGEGLLQCLPYPDAGPGQEGRSSRRVVAFERAQQAERDFLLKVVVGHAVALVAARHGSQMREGELHAAGPCLAVSARRCSGEPVDARFVL